MLNKTEPGELDVARHTALQNSEEISPVRLPTQVMTGLGLLSISRETGQSFHLRARSRGH
jgi:hypothetical protein